MSLFGRSIQILVVAIIAVAVFAVAKPTLAAPGGSLTGYSLNAADCYVDITATVQDGGFYAINMWDDGNFRAGAGLEVAAGGSITVRFYIGGLILQGATGIGVYLENAVGTAASTTYDSDGSAQLWSDPVGTDCASRGVTWGATALGGVCANPLPDGTPIYSVPNGAPMYYDPNPGTYVGNLPPGTWYITGFVDGYARVWIACSSAQVYIPIESVVR
ncbi:MAG: hypothetical protein U0528_07475 [Anaerolineae bacterium]